jgi:activator of Hsp90 ATPase-like protein
VTEVSASTRVHRPVSDVWRWYAVEHVQNHPRWDPDMHLEQITPGAVGLGTRIRRRNTRWGAAVDGEMVITEWEPEHVLGTQIWDTNMEIHGRATLASLTPDETQLTILIEVPGLDPQRADVMRQRLNRTAQNIKELIESEA